MSNFLGFSAFRALARCALWLCGLISLLGFLVCWLEPLSPFARCLSLLLLSSFALALRRRARRRWRALPEAFCLTSSFMLLSSGLLLPARAPRLGAPELSTATISQINNLVEEKDLVLLGARILPWIGGITRSESLDLVRDLQAHYQDLEADQGAYSSPLIASIFAPSDPNSVEMVSFCNAECREHKRSAALIFLHGSAGNFSLLCWLASRSVSSLGIETICPSHNFAGDWGSEEGKGKVMKLISQLQIKGVGTIYLAGLSAGAIGAAELAPQLEKQLAGIILLFGGHPDIEHSSLPALMIYGRNDERFPLNVMRLIAALRERSAGALNTVEVNGTHFHLLQQPDSVTGPIHDWVAKQEGTRRKL